MPKPVVRPFPRLACTMVTAMALLAAASVYAQFGRRSIAQNAPPATEFIAARWRFGTNGWFGNMGWSHNYPDSDQHLNEYIGRSTRVNVDIGSYRIVDLGSPEIFDYPFAYVSEPGEMELTEEEVTNLREFIGRGGFILMDDFDGAAQFANMRSQVLRAFPGRDLVPMDIRHGLFRQHFELTDLDGMSPYVPGGDITYYGLLDDEGQVSIAAGHNNDLANFWDWYAQGQMPLEPSTDAFRLGTNAVVYSFTH